MGGMNTTYKHHDPAWFAYLSASICAIIIVPPGRREQSFGYNVDPHGKLLALPAPSSTRTGLLKDSAGPGDYDTQDNSWWAGVGAAKFSKGARKTIFDGDCAAKDRRPVRRRFCCRRVRKDIFVQHVSPEKLQRDIPDMRV